MDRSWVVFSGVRKGACAVGPEVSIARALPLWFDPPAGHRYAMRSRLHTRAASPRLTPRPSRRGFTLPEILIVIVLISLLSLAAIPRFAVANGKRHMQSAKMRVAAAAATARAAAIQKGQQVRFMIKSNRVTVIAIVPPKGDTVRLISPVPLDTLYDVKASGSSFTPTSDSLVVNFSARGFAVGFDNSTTITLKRSGVPTDSVVLTRTGMVQQ